MDDYSTALVVPEHLNSRCTGAGPCKRSKLLPLTMQSADVGGGAADAGMPLGICSQAAGQNVSPELRDTSSRALPCMAETAQMQNRRETSLRARWWPITLSRCCAVKLLLCRHPNVTHVSLGQLWRLTVCLLCSVNSLVF